MRILVVDDQQYNLRFMENYLKIMPYAMECFFCLDPLKTVEMVDQQAIDILFLDIVMAPKNGLEILHELRADSQYNDLQIIMLTAMDDQDSFKKSFEMGANDFLNKPVDLVALSARLKAAIQTRENTIFLKKSYEKIMHQNSELTALNQQLKETQFMMLQQDKMSSIGELAAGVAHEINNPLGFVSSNIESLANFIQKLKRVLSAYGENIEKLSLHMPVTAETQVFFDAITEAIQKNKLPFVVEEIDATIHDVLEGMQRIENIVKTLRTFARTGMEDDILSYNLKQILDEVLVMVRNEAKYVVEIDTDFSEDYELSCNKSQIGQVLLNLIVNAMHAIKSQNRTELGKIQIRVTKMENMLEIRICDDGPGILPENLSKIFNPFFTTKEVGKGTGLGLSISYDIIVNKHGGEIQVENNQGAGATFLIRLPTVLNLEQSETFTQ